MMICQIVMFKSSLQKKKSVSPTRCPSARKLASPTSSTQVSFRAPPLSRPQSASNLKLKDPASASARLNVFTSPRSRTKLSLITNPSVQNLENTSTPKYAQSVRSAMLSKTMTSPGATNRRYSLLEYASDINMTDQTTNRPEQK